MAEEIDPFEAAMSAMNGDDKPEESSDEHTDKDPFATGDGATDNAKTADSTTETPSEDPFDMAKAALEGDDSTSDEDGGAKSEDPFESALAAMDAVADEGGNLDIGSSMDDNLADDPFAAALEVAKTEHSVAEAQKPSQFEGQKIDIEFLMEIKMKITFEVGRTKMFISDLLSLGQGSVIELHRLVGEELDLFVNGQLLATGEVVVVNEKFGARIVQILSPEERLNRLAPTLVK